MFTVVMFISGRGWFTTESNVYYYNMFVYNNKLILFVQLTFTSFRVLCCIKLPSNKHNGRQEYSSKHYICFEHEAQIMKLKVSFAMYIYAHRF